MAKALLANNIPKIVQMLLELGTDPNPEGGKTAGLSWPLDC